MASGDSQIDKPQCGTLKELSSRKALILRETHQGILRGHLHAV